MSRLNIAIRASCGPASGLGHARRCLTLAQSLRRLDAAVHFILNDNSLMRKLVFALGFDSAIVRNGNDLRQTQDVLRRWNAAALVTDGYDIGPRYWGALRGHVRLMIAIDDLALTHLPVDVVVNSSPDAFRLEYSVLPGTRFLLGPSYAILRDEFAEEPKRDIPDRLNRVLVTMGGSDPFELMPQLTDWICETLTEVWVDLIVGPFFKSTRAIEQTREKYRDRVEIYRDPQDIRSLMLAADIAVTGGGQTTYELGATATPTLAICLDFNQRNSLSGLAREGTLLLAGDARDSELEGKIKSSLRSLAFNPDLRMKLRMRGRQMVDGLGARRVAQTIVEEYEQRSRGLK